MSTSEASAALPRLPTREELIGWVNSPKAPEEFHLSATNTDPNEPQCPLLAYLKQRYGMSSCEADGWRTLTCTGHGLSIVFDVDDCPHAIGYVRALELFHHAWPHDLPIPTLTRDELAYILRNWENPHAAAQKLEHARRLVASRPAAVEPA